MDYISIFAANYFIFIAISVAIITVLLTHERRHHLKHMSVIVGSAVVAWIVSRFLKVIIAHPRPDLTLALIVPDSVYSFPSGHASLMFALAFATYYYNKKVAGALILLAVFSGVARVAVGVHYWYDIVGGFVLGFFVAYIVMKLSKRFSRR